MRNGIPKNLKMFMVVCAIGLLLVFVLSCGGGGGGGGDDNDGPQTYTASGTYTYNSNTNVLTVTYTTSEFTDCGPEVGVQVINVDSFTATTMTFNVDEGGEMTWTRDSGTVGDITGTWHHTDENGNTYEATFNPDGSLVVTGEIVDCGDVGDDTPQTYTASGNYFYNPDTGMLVLTFVLSDFLGCGPVVGDQIEDVDSVTTTTMHWVANDMTWTRDSGTAGDILGTWEWVDEDGNAYEITFNNDFSMSVVGEIIDCDNDGQSLTITGASGNQVNLNGTWSSGCDPDIGDGSSETSVLTVSGSSFSQVENEWFDSTTCSGTSDVTLTISGTVVLGDELTATMGSSNVTATETDVVFTSVTGIVNNSTSASDLNNDNACGFNNWVAGTPKSLLGTSCFPDSSIKDILYIDDEADPDVWYSGEGEGPVDVNDYPTNVDSDTAKERM